MLIYGGKRIEGEVPPRFSFQRVDVWCESTGMRADGRPGAVCLNAVGQNGSARYSFECPVPGIQVVPRKMSIFRPEVILRAFFVL